MHTTKDSSMRAGYFGLILVAVAMSAAAVATVVVGPGPDQAAVAQSASLSMLATVLLAATYFDVTRLRIPNAVTYAAVVVAIGSNAATSLIPRSFETSPFTALGAVGLQQSLLGALTGFGIMAVVFTLTGRGAGDVKLAAAIGAFLGPTVALSAIVWTHLLAGAFALGWVVWTVGPWQVLSWAIRFAGSVVAPQHVPSPAWPDRRALNRPIALAGFFAVGAVLSLAGV